MKYLIILKNISIYVLGVILLSGFLTIVKYYDTTLTNDSFLVAGLAVAWGNIVLIRTIFEFKKLKYE